MWRRVADLADIEFQGFIDESRHAVGALTMAAPLRRLAGSTPVPAKATVTLTLSDADHCAFVRQVDVLGAAYFTETPSETVMLVLGRAYASWLAAQKAATDRGR